MGEHFETLIDGLVVSYNRFIEDERGFLAELLPGGTDNAQAKEGIKNIYISSANGISPRAGHYHHRQTENFFVVRGSALWAFYDFRDDSRTKGESAAVILTTEKDDAFTSDYPVYRRGEKGMPGITVPVGVYHVYWPISASMVDVICVASTPYDPDDYVNILPADIPSIQKMRDSVLGNS
ncbi:MAG: hypothetical protein WC817_04220 [Patescibacteria group bacterium]|jgi:dTDP-4-dehydrorhamnose 3,5-epimerase